MSGNEWRHSTSVFLIGLGVGAGLGVLFAPKSGEETREEIADAVKDGADEIAAQWSRLGRLTRRTIKDAKKQVRGAAEAGEQAYREAKTIFS
jgi:gas vesicle protein